MKYFILFFAVVFFSSIIFFVFFQKRMKKQILKNNLTCLFEKKTDSGYNFNLFLSLLIDLITDYILKQPKKEREMITNGLKKQSFDMLIKQSKAKMYLIRRMTGRYLLNKNRVLVIRYKFKKKRLLLKTKLFIDSYCGAN